MIFTQLSTIPSREFIPGFHGKMIHTERMTFAYWEIEAGAVLPEHAHPHEQVAHMIEGEFEFTIDGMTQVVIPGMLTVVPSNMPHAGRAITACKILDVFQPTRDDYR
ncbi:MAG: cupin domain-containing protein [Bacteroidia bacterium]|nr:cupin domain-containing protein [Bacteroidia bacterium]